MHLHDRQNDIVSTQPVHDETTAKRQRLPSPVNDKLPSQRPSPVLPYDLLIEILLRLPVRSLLQFSCVCKSWKILISDPQFAKSHLRSSTADSSMTHQRLVFSKYVQFTENCRILSCPLKPLFENPPTSAKVVSITMSRKYDIFGSCNGLLCLYDWYDGYCLELWNPATRLKSKRSPIVFSKHDKVITYYGFGYDQVNDKYKVLVAGEGHFRKIVTKVYTFGTNSWRTVQNLACIPASQIGKFVSGTLNWVANKGESWVIFSFDLEKETYREVLFPRQDGDNISYPTLHVLRNCLCYVCSDSNKTHWVVWLMKEYAVVESWTKLVMIPRDKLWSPKWRPCFELLSISKNGVVLVKTMHAELVLYDSKDDAMLKYYSKIWIKVGLDLQVYHESLISPQW